MPLGAARFGLSGADLGKLELIETNDHNAAYYILSVEDVTNNRYEMSEVIVLNDSSETYITEYGNITSVAGLGTVGAAVSSNYVNLYYTPNASTHVQVRVFQMSLQIAAENSAITSVHQFELDLEIMKERVLMLLEHLIYNTMEEIYLQEHLMVVILL